jgi:hypothetical protein
LNLVAGVVTGGGGKSHHNKNQEARASREHKRFMKIDRR